MSENGSSKKQRRTSSRGYKPTREESGTSRKIGVTSKQRLRGSFIGVLVRAEDVSRARSFVCMMKQLRWIALDVSSEPRERMPSGMSVSLRRDPHAAVQHRCLTHTELLDNLMMALVSSAVSHFCISQL